MSPTYVDIHVLQDLPPSNINRDENGTPKHATYGGVERLRVSSQAWKRATRKHFQAHLDEGELGVRTRRLRSLLAQLLVERGLSEADADAKALMGMAALGLKAGKKENEGQYLLFAGRAQLGQLADALVDAADAKEVDAKGLLGSVHPLDVALFGRMIADMTQLNVDAAAQVAHAISTHPAQTQFDYFTAVDDLQEKDEMGAGMIGTVEFSSATVYRFATVGLEQLIENMGDADAANEGVGQFIRSFILSMPTGHQNSFAARTRPGLVAVVVREDQPVNLVSAFETPVRGRTGGVMEESQRALAAHFSSELERWGDTPRLTAASYTASGAGETSLVEAFGQSVPIAELVEQVSRALREVRSDA